jgi:uncharacterized protein (DUF362 family)
MSEISRRDFIRRVLTTGGALAATTTVGFVYYGKGYSQAPAVPLATLPDYRVPVSATLPLMVIVRGLDAAKNTRAAIDALGGIGRFIGKSETVTLKPNLGFDRTPEQAGCTNPEVIAELARLCLTAGAAKVKVGDHPCVDPRRSYYLSGTVEALKDINAEIIYPADEHTFTEMAVPGERIKSWPVFTELANADRIINVPIAKHHSLAGLTLGMKNWFGIIGGRRNQLHQDINTTIADLGRLVRPTLTVIDATRILIAHGPSGGRLDDVLRTDTIIASTDPVAADAFAATLFGKTASDLPYLARAAAAGLGSEDWKTVRHKEIKV